MIAPIYCWFDPLKKNEQNAFSIYGIGRPNCISYIKPDICDPSDKYPGLYTIYATSDRIVFNEGQAGIKFPDLTDMVQSYGLKQELVFMLRTDSLEEYETIFDIYQSASVGLLIDRRKDRRDDIEYVVFNGVDAVHIFHDLFRYVTDYGYDSFPFSSEDSGNNCEKEIRPEEKATKSQIKSFIKRMLSLKQYDRSRFVYETDVDDYCAYWTEAERSRIPEDVFFKLRKANIEWDIEQSEKKRHPSYEIPQDISGEPFECIYPKTIDQKILKEMGIALSHIGYGIYKAESDQTVSQWSIDLLPGVSFIGRIVSGTDDYGKIDPQYQILYAYSKEYAARDIEKILQLKSEDDQQLLTELGLFSDTDFSDVMLIEADNYDPLTKFDKLTKFDNYDDPSEQQEGQIILRWTNIEKNNEKRVLLGRFIGERVCFAEEEKSRGDISGVKAYYVHDPRPVIHYSDVPEQIPYIGDIDISEIPEDKNVIGLCIGTENDRYHKYPVQFIFICDHYSRYGLPDPDQYDYAYLYDFRAKRVLRESRYLPEGLIQKCITARRADQVKQDKPVELISGYGLDHISLHLKLYPAGENFDYAGTAYWDNGELVLESVTADGRRMNNCRIPRDLILELSVDVTRKLRCDVTVNTREKLISAKDSLQRMSDPTVYDLYSKIMNGESYYIPDSLIRESNCGF